MTFEEFLSTRLRDLLRFAVVLCGDSVLAEDLVQEVVLRAHTRWDRIGGTDHPFAYVRRMLVNEHLAWRRKWSRQISTADITPQHTEPDHADRITERDDLAARLDGLPRRQRTVVVLRYYAGLSDSEIAETLGCSSGAVRGYLSRALSSMRVQLRSELVAEFDFDTARKDA